MSIPQVVDTFLNVITGSHKKIISLFWVKKLNASDFLSENIMHRVPLIFDGDELFSKFQARFQKRALV